MPKVVLPKNGLASFGRRSITMAYIVYWISQAGRSLRDHHNIGAHSNHSRRLFDARLVRTKCTPRTIYRLCYCKQPCPLGLILERGIRRALCPTWLYVRDATCLPTLIRNQRFSSLVISEKEGLRELSAS
jgi:hypothetical protein